MLLFLGYMIGQEIANLFNFLLFSKPRFIKMLFFGTSAKISQECLIQSPYPFLIKQYTMSGKNVSSTDPN